MSTRSKLKSLFGRHKDREGRDSPPHDSNNTQSFGYEGAASGQTPQSGQRPLSGSDVPSQTGSQPKRSIDRRSHPTPITNDLDSRSLDMKRQSVDQPGLNDGRAAPQLPEIPSTYRDEAITLPHTSNETSQTKAQKSEARKSSQAINFNLAQGQPLATKSDPYSENVANYNIVKAHEHDIVPPPVGVKKPSRHSTASSTYSLAPMAEPHEGAVSRKPVGGMTGATQPPPDRPLPTVPGSIGASRHLSKDQEYLVKDAKEAPSLEGVIDLRNTEETHVTEIWAPAVTHETVNRDIHHIREELIDREIHTHDVYHRILPVIDIEVLPARHFVPAGDGNLIEIAESEIPGRTRYNQQWFVAETLSKLPKDSMPTNGPRQFSAIDFPGDAGDHKEYVSELGVPTKETTWVHPPTIEEGGKLTGQTQPFHFGAKDPADNGLRIQAPHGNIIGSSRVHAGQSGLLEPPTDSMNDLSLQDNLHGVPDADMPASKGQLTSYEKERVV